MAHAGPNIVAPLGELDKTAYSDHVGTSLDHNSAVAADSATVIAVVEVHRNSVVAGAAQTNANVHTPAVNIGAVLGCNW